MIFNYFEFINESLLTDKEIIIKLTLENKAL